MPRKTKTQRPTPRKALDQLEGLPDNYLQCREMRSHAWAVREDFHVVRDYESTYSRKRLEVPRGSLVRRSLICMRCDTSADDYYAIRRTAGLEMLVRAGSRVYHYAEGYQIKNPAPSGFSTTDLAKHEAYRRAMSKIELKEGNA